MTPRFRLRVEVRHFGLVGKGRSINGAGPAIANGMVFSTRVMAEPAAQRTTYCSHFQSTESEIQ
jgi:hypothetical protein